MNNSISYKSKQFFWLIIKLSIVIVCGFFIWKKLIEYPGFNFLDFYQNSLNRHLFSIKNISILCFFSFLNHFLEIYKWKLLASVVMKTSFLEATKQCLASFTTSLITPNRIGEYGIKALYFKTKHIKKIIGLNFIGNFYQLIATLFFGIIGCILFSYQHKTAINRLAIIKNTLLIFIFLTIAFFLLKNNKFFTRTIQKVKNFSATIPLHLNLKIGFLSFLRYFVFSHQFYILLLFFGIDILYIDAFSAITSIYLVASVVPMMSFFDVVLKGSVAVWFFSYLMIDAYTILSITTIMWMFNVVAPAIIGSYFVLIFKPIIAK